MTAAPLLEVRGLTLGFDVFSTASRGPDRRVLAVDGVDLALRAGETLALVGESGSGKTLTALALLGLLPPNARQLGGEIRWRGRELTSLGPRERRALCGREIAMSFQEPASALNPVFSIGEQLAEGLRFHAGLSRKAARERALAMLLEVGLADAAERLASYPHELSGGERQRVMLAMALSLGPSLLIADEPTSGLDTAVQAEVLRLLARLRQRREMALLLVTHDLAVVAELSERVAVMYAGRIVEEASVLELFERPAHPYTQGLLRSRPQDALPGARLAALPGSVPSPGAWPSGCRFRPRCPLADARCANEIPRLAPVEGAGSEHRAACHHVEEARRR